MSNENSSNEDAGGSIPEHIKDAYKKDIDDTRANIYFTQKQDATGEADAQQPLFSIKEYTEALTSAGISLDELLRSVYQRADIEGSRAQVTMQRALAKELSKKESIVLPETTEAKEGLYKLYLELEEFTAPGATHDDLNNALSVLDSMTAIYSSPALSELRKRTALRLERAQEKQAWNAQ